MSGIIFPGKNANAQDVTERNQTPASYIVWFDGTNYHADSMTGMTDYSNVNAATAINAALSGMTSGGILFIKQNTYFITSPLYINSNTQIIAEHGTIFNDNGTVLGAVNGTDNLVGLVMNANTGSGNINIEIGGITFIGTPPNAGNSTYSNAIRTFGVSGLWLHDLTINGCGITIDAIRATDFNTAVQPILSKSNKVTLERITFTNSCPYGLVVTHAGNVVIRNIVGLTNSSIDDMVLLNDSSQNALIENCYLDKSLSDGVHINAGNCIRIQGNTNAFGFENVLVSNNYVRACNGGNAGIQVTPNGINATNIVISNNFCESGSQASTSRGISWTTTTSGSADCVIRNNHIRGNGGPGIYLETTIDWRDLLIEGNTVYNNAINDANHYGIRCIPTAGKFTNLKIVNNNIYDSGSGTQQQSIRLESGGSGYWYPMILDNFLSGSSNNNNLSVQGTIINGVFKNNIGYNPVGYITPDGAWTGSPFTYKNNDSVDETVFVYSGSVTGVTGSGGISFLTGSFYLQPSQAVVITTGSSAVIPVIKRIGY